MTLALAMLIALVPGAALPVRAAEEDALVYGGMKYTVTDEDTVTITGYTDDLPSELVIPEAIEEKPVTSIGEMAFQDCASLKCIFLPVSVTSIDAAAFQGCTSLTDIHYTGTEEQWNAIEIGEDAIPEGTKINYNSTGHAHTWDDGAITKEPTCTEQGEKTFSCECGEKKTEAIPATGHTWGDYEITKQPTCTEAGEKTFFCTNCDATKTEVISATGHTWDEYEITKNPTCTEQGEQVSACLKCGIKETRKIAALGHDYKTVVAPPTCTEKGYTTYTCSRCGDINMDDYVDATGHTFGEWTVTKAATCTEDGAETRSCANCDEAENRVVEALGHDFENVVTLPTETEQGYTTHTCKRCGYSYKDEYTDPMTETTVGLKYIVTKEGSVTISGHTDDLPEKVVIPKAIEGKPVTKIGTNAFAFCTDLKRVYIPSTVTEIENDAFRRCANLADITIPDSVTAIGESAFLSCASLTKITLPKDLKKISTWTFGECTSLTEVVLPEGLTEIGGSAFRECTALTGVTIPERVTKIGSSAFADCAKLNRFEVPKNVTAIGDGVVAGCVSLKSISVAKENKAYTVVDGVLFSGDKTLLAAYPAGKGSSYTIADSVTEIGGYAFAGAKDLTSVTLPKNLKKIGLLAFAGCYGLKAIDIPASVTSIDGYTFSACTSLTEVTLPQGLKEIPAGIFEDCSALTKATIPVSVTKIGDHAFANCVKLTDIHYAGTHDQWKKVELGELSIPEKATIHCKTIENKFQDVKESDYFYEPVHWAVDNGITAGMSKTKFGPSNPCTRAQIVTFLYKACGEPEIKATKNPFTDVKESDYFYKPVLWAVENGITSGMSKTTFGSNVACTRAHAVTFLYKAFDGKRPAGAKNPFSDVKSGDYYYDAVLWAVENKITSGMSATQFGPSNTCTRGQIVTFLYKAVNP